MKKSVRLLLICLCLTVSFLSAAQASVRPGDTGEEVRALQQMLVSAGYSISVDGTYGGATTSAVLAFQRANSLKIDGIAGAQTISALGGGTAALPTGGDVPAPGGGGLAGRYELGNTGSGVSQLQTRLTALGFDTGSTDGVFDPPTRVAVMAFQRQQGLAVDGIAGRATLARLTAPVLAPTENAPPVADTALGGTAVVNTGNTGSLRMRTHPTTKGENVIAALKNGQRVELLGLQGEWTRIRYNGRAGYVMSSFLAQSPVGESQGTPIPGTQPTPAPTQAPLPQGAQGKATVATGNGKSVNVRTSPENKGNANYLTQVRNGEVLEVLSSGASWSQVRYRGQACYIMTSFLRFTQLGPAPEVLPTPVPGESASPEQEEQIEFTRTLRTGHEGPDVSAMQARLETLRYAITPSGRYDSATATALRNFQKLNGLAADGVFGPQSARVLFSSAARISDSAPLDFTPLRMGDVDGSGTAVTLLQTALKNLGFSLGVDGTYGTKTHDAVVGFQMRNALTVSGVADALMQNTLYSGTAKGADAPVPQVDPGTATGAGPDGSGVQLLDWYSEVKPQIRSGQTAEVYHPASGISFNLQYYSLGRHADSEPKSLKDTQLMNQAFGEASWDTRSVYVKMPNGTWTLATMHNYPHLYGGVTDNGFGGHLCVHFKRDLEETSKVDPNYGMQNQTAIRNAWQRITGIVVN